MDTKPSDGRIFWIAPLVMMALGLLPMPSAFYFFSRLVICGASIFYVVELRRNEDFLFAWIFGFLAVLYNPLVPVHLGEKSLWIIVNLGTAVLFLLKRHVFEPPDPAP